MDADEARFILSAVRADRLDEADPQVEEALRLVESDLELRSWFEQSGRFDRLVSDRLAEVEPPADLRTSLRAGIKVSRPRSWERRAVVFFAAAAMLTLGLFLSAALRSGASEKDGPEAASLAEFREDVLERIAGMKTLDLRSDDPEFVRTWLRDRGLPVDDSSLSALGERSLVGCKIIDWRGRRVSLICFRRGDVEGMPNLHLVTAPAESLERSAMLRTEPVVGKEWSTAAWREGDLLHLVLAKGRHRDLRSLIPFG